MPTSGVHSRARTRPSLRAVRLLILLVVGVLPLSACDDRSALERARERGFVRAGYSEEPPYAFRDTSGRVTGESPEALRSVAERIGIPEIRWVRLDFGDLIPALRQGRVDIVTTGLYRTEARAEQVRFSRPTLCSEPALVVRRDAAVSGDLAELAAEGGHVAVLGGSVEESALEELQPGRQWTVRVPDLATGIAGVLEGSVDALAVTAPTARLAVAREGEESLEAVKYEPPPDLEGALSGCSALAFRRREEDDALARTVDEALGQVLGSAGHVETLRSLGFTPREIEAATNPDPSERP